MAGSSPAEHFEFVVGVCSMGQTGSGEVVEVRPDVVECATRR